MNNKDFEITLNENLKGVLIPHNDYGGWSVSNKIYNIFKLILNNDQIKDLNVEKGNWRGNMSTYYLRYKGWNVCEIKFTRKKGDWHYNCFGNSYCDYYFNDFKVSDFDFDTKKKEIDDLVAKQQQAQKETEQRMQQIFNKIYDEHGVHTGAIIDYMHKHLYSLERGAKK